MLCENVKVLKFRDIQRLHGTQEVTNWLKIPNYKNIELSVEQCDPRIFKILKNIQARKFHTTCVEFAHRQYFVDLVEFLRSQEELEELVLAEFMGKLTILSLFTIALVSMTFVTIPLPELIFNPNHNMLIPRNLHIQFLSHQPSHFPNNSSSSSHMHIKKLTRSQTKRKKIISRKS
jgi:hypothetical protein